MPKVIHLVKKTKHCICSDASVFSGSCLTADVKLNKTGFLEAIYLASASFL